MWIFIRINIDLAIWIPESNCKFNIVNNTSLVQKVCYKFNNKFVHSHCIIGNNKVYASMDVSLVPAVVQNYC